jgi:hypothetical protein
MNATKTLLTAVMLALALILATSILKQETYARDLGVEVQGAVLLPKPFYIVSALNGMVTDILGANPAENAHIGIWPMGPTNQHHSQLWTFTSEEYIKSQLNGLVLQVLNPPANTQQSYRDVVMASPINIAAQKWTRVPGPSGYYLIQSKLNGMVLDVRGANTAAGTQVIADPAANADDQSSCFAMKALYGHNFDCGETQMPKNQLWSITR